MRLLICRLAWWILWRWWPDRLIEVWNDSGTGFGRTPTKVLTSSEWENLGEYYKNDVLNSSWTHTVEKLDHKGREPTI